MTFLPRPVSIVAALCVCVIHAAPALAACKGVPADQRFVVAPKGTGVLDCASGLIWFRCSVGQSWDATTQQCTGQPYRATWNDVQDYAAEVHAHGFVLPTQAQLAQLVSAQQWYPRINAGVFPGTPAGSFWTREAFAAWKPGMVVPPGLVDFSNGHIGEDRMSPDSSGFYLRYILIPGSREAVAAGFPAPGE